MLKFLTILSCDGEGCNIIHQVTSIVGWLVRDSAKCRGWVTGLVGNSIGAPRDYCPECAKARGFRTMQRRKASRP